MFCLFLHVFACFCLFLPVCMYVCMYVCTYVCMYACMYVHTYIHMYVRMYVHTCIHTYIRTYAHAYIHGAPQAPTLSPGAPQACTGRAGAGRLHRARRAAALPGRAVEQPAPAAPWSSLPRPRAQHMLNGKFARSGSQFGSVADGDPSDTRFPRPSDVTRKDGAGGV